MRNDPSELLMEFTFEHLGISYEASDIWNDNLDDLTIDRQAIEEIIEHYHPELKDEIIEAIEALSAEGQARTFGMWVDVDLCKNIHTMFIEEGKSADFADEMLDGHEDEDLVYYVAVLHGDIHCIVNDETEGAMAIAEEAVAGEQWDTLAGLLVDLD